MTGSLFAGLMSGTSLDGVDAVLADFSAGVRLLATSYRPFPADLREELLALQSPGTAELDRAALAGVRLAELYAQGVLDVLRSSGVPAAAVAAIGCHGQTLRHAPQLGYSLQLNQPALLAERTGITVVADFRSRDIAAGGQGAPLVPAFHQALFSDRRLGRAILNIGGIANVTHLPALDLAQARVTGFDTGPGNVLMDLWIQRHQGARYDANGDWAATGTPLEPLLECWLADGYFAAPPPKSTGRDLFNATWMEKGLPADGSAEDVQATLAMLTARSIAHALTRWCPGFDELFACGGGAHNRQLMKLLQQELPATRVSTTADLGLDPDWVEAAAFAWLARQCLTGQPGNLPAVTGAAGPRLLGAVYPA